MSISAMTQVWEHSKVKGTELLLLLALADYANDKGIAWPGIDSLAHRIRQSRRNVTRLLRNLEKRGELTIEVNAGPYGANLYKLPVVALAMTNRKPKCPAPHDKQETQMSSEPSLTTKEQSLTIAAAEYFEQFRRKRWATRAQQKLFETTEQAVGAAIMLAAVRWAAQNNIAKVPSICTAAKKMAKKQVQYGGHGGRIPAAGAGR